jgi:hypothetical protein
VQSSSFLYEILPYIEYENRFNDTVPSMHNVPSSNLEMRNYEWADEKF